eukprot:ANDGO_05563.mRNA.1 hypothetical protein ACA1_140250
MKVPTLFEVGLYTLFLLMGFFPFLLINSIFSELPFLVDTLPEGKSIGVYIGAAFQVANISSFIYIFVNERKPIRDTISLPLLSSLGIADAFLLSALWNKRVNSTSFWVLLCTFLSGIVGCTGVVALFGYVSKFKMTFLSGVSTGLAASGIVSALLSLCQGAGSSASRFSVSIFFVIVGVFMIFAFFALMALILVPKLRSAASDQHAFEEAVLLASASFGTDDESPSSAKDGHSAKTPLPMLFRAAMYPLSMIFLQALQTYFVAPGIEPFLSADLDVLVWTANCFLVGNVVGRAFSSVFVTHKLHVCNLVQCALMVYMIVCGLAPSLKHNAKAAWTIPPAMFLFSAVAGYTNTMVYGIVQRRFCGLDRDRLSRWASVSNQTGALVGTFLALIIVVSGGFK